jgi:hypothetical protein
MNITQLQYNLEYLLNLIRKKNQEEIEIGGLKIIHRYSIYFIGNRNYIQHYQENKITLFGILDQLISDLCHALNNQYAAVPGPAPGPAPGMSQRIDLDVIQGLCEEMSNLAYGHN